MGSRSQVAKPKKARFKWFGDTIAELKKVTWPTRQETLRLTVLCIIVSAIVGLILGVLDYGFAELVSKVFLGGK